MTNDDPLYVRQLESALEGAEKEIKGLEDELRKSQEIAYEMHKEMVPTHMGEPVIPKCKNCCGTGEVGESDDGASWWAVPCPVCNREKSCATCANRGQINGTSQETFCENCSRQGHLKDHWRTK